MKYPKLSRICDETWDLASYAGAEEEQATARADLVAEAMRRLPECVPVRRASPRTAWRWTNKWSPRAIPEDVAVAVLNDRLGAMELLKDAVERTPRGPEVLNNLRAQWDDLHQPVMRHQVASAQAKRKKLISEAIERLPEVVRHIGFFGSQRPDDAPVSEWSSGVRKEPIAEAVLNDEPGAMDRLCASMVPPVFRSGRVILKEMRTQWADIQRHGRRDEFLAFAIERLPAIAADIAPSLEWRKDEKTRRRRQGGVGRRRRSDGAHPGRDEAVRERTLNGCTDMVNDAGSRLAGCAGRALQMGCWTRSAPRQLISIPICQATVDRAAQPAQGTLYADEFAACGVISL